MYAESEKYIRLQKSQIAYAAHVLANAFHEDPVYRHFLHDHRQRSKFLPLFFRHFLTLAHDVSDVWCTGVPAKGVAIWVAPEQQEECARQMEIARQRILPAIMEEEAATRFTNFLVWLDALRCEQTREPHWYLALLGVDPVWQHQGIGTGLMRYILRRTDEKGVCSYLETQQPANLPFYRRLGFRVTIDRAIEPKSGLAVWALKRNPRTV